ncbi:MAG: hypothetical protein U0X39_00990 [Bacteroidales bacterium]
MNSGKRVRIIDMHGPAEKALLQYCNVCPRQCGVNRYEGAEGYCGTDAGLNIASICIHQGEEPAISGFSGICNVFFGSCNLRCLFCQNHEISRKDYCYGSRYSELHDVLDTIENILSRGVRSVGFVSPSHVVPQVITIIKGLRERGLSPVTVYNTNGYDRKETLRLLEGYIDVYLPDFKYSYSESASLFSDAADYPQVALDALKEMYYQKGSSLVTDDDGVAVNGILVRHLVLPGHVAESCKILETIAGEISTGLSISLMSQYHPMPAVKGHPSLGRILHPEEYREVAECMERLGFRNGYLQDPGSNDNYLPDFSREHPFTPGLSQG